jgi:hypothetical protein
MQIGTEGHNRAGPAFVATLRSAQAQGGITVDGKYGRNTHALIAPYFTPDDEALYHRHLRHLL